MRILITGANGLLGQKLVTLLQQDENVYLIATARNIPAQKLNRGEFHKLDITNSVQVQEIIQAAKPDAIINTAAMTHVDACETEREACIANNVTAVSYLLEACKENHVRFIHVSTDFIFDGTHGPLDEQAKPNPINFYGESKLAAEKLILNSEVDWCILRTVLVYGITADMSRSNIVLWVKKSLEEGKNISVVNDQWRTPTLAEDLAMGCYLATVKNAKGVYNISGEDFITPYDIALRTAKFFELDSSLISATDSTKFKQPAARPLKTGFIIEKAKRDLNYKPHSFEQGLQIIKDQLR